MYKPTEYEITKIKRGEADMEAGRVVTWEDAKTEAHRKLRVALSRKAQRKGSANAAKVRRSALIAG